MQKESLEKNSEWQYFREDFIDAFSVIIGINSRTKSTFYVNVISHITLSKEPGCIQHPGQIQS